MYISFKSIWKKDIDTLIVFNFAQTYYLSNLSTKNLVIHKTKIVEI